MKHSSVFFQVVRLCTVILVGILLLPLVPGQGSQVIASPPGEALSLAQRSADEQSGARVQAWTRTLDPVMVAGSQLSLFDGVALADLFVYAYDGSTWNVVPFQFDEVDSEDTFVPFEDGLLDSNDELVFMAADLGGMATPYEWLDDADAKNNSRYEVRVTNPLNAAEEGWVYVYHSATLAPTFAPYVTWDSANNSIVASTYIIGYTPSDHLGIDSLQLNGFPGDVLDRSKLRLSGDCLTEDGWESFNVTEDSEEVIDEWEPPDILGPVRVGGGTLDEPSWAYASMFEDRASFYGETDKYGQTDKRKCDKIRYDLFRISEDWLSPLVSGMAPMGYFDSNVSAGVLVDGLYDFVPSTPLVTWRQVSGAKGSIVQVTDVSAAGSAITNYYLDLVDENSEDTGDHRSFGDAGFRVANPEQTVKILIAHYVLDAFQVNVGETYRQYYTNPLQAAATAQDYVDPLPNDIYFSWQPKPLYLGAETTFTAVVGGGVAPFIYTWTFGDDGTAVGNPVTHTFTVSGTIPVTLMVTNDYGASTPMIKPVIVWQPGTVPYYIYSPVILKQEP